jgi:hypothetical protein
MKAKFNGIAMFAAMVLGFGCASQAHATITPPVLQISDGALGDIITVDSNGVAVYSGNCAAIGHICSTTFSGAAGGQVIWNGNIDGFHTALGANNITGSSGPAVTYPQMLDLNSINVAATGAGTIQILWSANNFNLYGGGFTEVYGGTGQNSSVRYSTYYDAGNNPLALTTLIADTGVMGPFVSPTGYSGSVGGAHLAPGSNYSLTQKLVLSFSGVGQDSGNFALNSVPEPASVALFGGVLLFTVGAIRRKARRA